MYFVHKSKYRDIVLICIVPCPTHTHTEPQLPSVEPERRLVILSSLYLFKKLVVQYSKQS